jgi:hypothetical protein
VKQTLKAAFPAFRLPTGATDAMLQKEAWLFGKWCLYCAGRRSILFAVTKLSQDDASAIAVFPTPENDCLRHGSQRIHPIYNQKPFTMKKSFSARRVARKVGQDEEDESSGSAGASGAETSPRKLRFVPLRPGFCSDFAPNRWLMHNGVESAVKRPHLSSKPKKKSALRLSFGPGEIGTGASKEDDGDTTVFTPKKSNLSRLAMERNAERKSLRPSSSTESLTSRPGISEDRPSYSKDYLAELKQSTPSTPKDLGSLQTSEDEEMSLDVVSKFGPFTTLGSGNPAIPTDAEIREKKERRARMAKAPDFLSLDGDDSDEERGQELLIRPKEKYAETRFVSDDEDVAEGFDDFTEDGKIALGRKSEREQARKKRLEMKEMILEAEGVGSDQASDDSEAERNEAYEAAQRRAGTYGQSGLSDAESRRPKTPPRIAPVPELGAVLLKLKTGLQTMEQSKAAKLRKLEELRAEKKDIAQREVWIQAQLKETGERYERLRLEAGTPNDAGGTLVPDRGLDSMGTTPLALSDVSDG